MWLVLAFLSAALLGFYDAFKKKALSGNAVIPVLFLNTLFSSLIFLPFIILSYTGNSLDGTMFHVAEGGWEVHKYIVLKSFIVLSSWIFGYFGMKHLPLTIVGPINATRPVMTLVGALLVYGEVLNLYQWIGVILAIISFAMLSRSGKKEGIDFKHNKWIYFIVLAAVLGAVSGLYDKYLMAPPENGGVGLDRMIVQSWYNIYQCFLMGAMLLMIWWPTKKNSTPFHWHWSIIFISIFLCLETLYLFHLLVSRLCRLRIFLCAQPAGCYDQYRKYDSSWFGHRQLPLRCSHLPREEPQGEVRGSPPRLARNALPLLRNEVMIIKKSCKPMCLQDFFIFLPDMCTLVLRNKELVALLDVECLIP